MSAFPVPSPQVRYDDIKKYVINLDHATARLEQMNQDLVGVFIRIPAVNGRQLELKKLRDYFQVTRANLLYQVGITPVQMACTLSHFHTYQAIVANPEIADHEWVLICEDDNRFIPEFPLKLEQLVNHLNQARFEHAEFCQLRISQIKYQVDFYHELTLFDKDHKEFRLLRQETLRSIPLDKLRLLFHSYLWRYLRHNHQSNFRLVYQNVAPSPNPIIYNEVQNVFVPYLMTPQSSACYLIRKSACQRIVSMHEKRFWIADDFKQIIPVQHMLYCSRLLALGNEFAEKSSVLDDTTLYNYEYGRVITPEQIRISRILRDQRSLLTDLYSTDTHLRQRTLRLHNCLGLRPQVCPLAAQCSAH